MIPNNECTYVADLETDYQLMQLTVLLRNLEDFVFCLLDFALLIPDMMLLVVQIFVDQNRRITVLLIARLDLSRVRLKQVIFLSFDAGSSVFLVNSWLLCGDFVLVPSS